MPRCSCPGNVSSLLTELTCAFRIWWTVIAKGSENTGFMRGISGTMALRVSTGPSSKLGAVSGREELFPKRAGGLCYDFLPRPLCSIPSSPGTSSWVKGSEGLAPDGAVSCSRLPAPRLRAGSVIHYYVHGRSSAPQYGIYRFQKPKRLNKTCAPF